MRRRKLLAGLGAGVATLGGGVAVADATRADIAFEGALQRPDGQPVSTTKTVGEDAVRDGADTEPFDRWARWTAYEHAAETVLSVVDDRLDEPVSGLGRGVRSLLFGPVVTVDHGVTRNRDGEVVSEPNVPLDRVVSVAPRTMTVTVELNGQAATREVPVAVSESETVYLDG